jgi:hypothetical protein
MEVFFIKVMERYTMPVKLQTADCRPGNGMIEAFLIRVCKDDRDVHIYVKIKKSCTLIKPWVQDYTFSE